MASPPNFVAARAHELHGKIRVELASPPVSWGLGFIYSLAFDAAESLAIDILRALPRDRAHAIAKVLVAELQTTRAEKSTASSSGG